MLGSWTIMISAMDFVLKKTVPAQADGWPHEDTGSPRSSGDIPTSLRHSEGTREEFEALKSSRRPAQNRLGTRPKIRPGGHDAGDAWCLRYSLLHQISAVQHQTVHPISAAVGKLQISSGSPPKECRKPGLPWPNSANNQKWRPQWFMLSNQQPLGFKQQEHGDLKSHIYHLVMTNITMEHGWTWPIEIDGLPFLKMVIFHGYVSHNQRVYRIKLEIRVVVVLRR